MVFMSRGKTETEDMASPGLNRSFMNDSLENGKWSAAVEVGPETLNGDADYYAFSGENDLYLGLFPHYVVNLLQDKSNWKNRVSGIGKIQSVIDGTQDSTVLESNLAMIVELVTGPLGDTHFKVAQTGLQLVGSLVSKVGRSLEPYLATLVPCILAKMGSNKYAIKQVGMRVMMQLMRCLRPEQVVREVGNCGLRHKTSRVREESINVIIAALLTFPKTDFHLLPLIREVSPCLYDSKQKVRQASLEVLTLLTSMMERGDLKTIVATIASVDPTKRAAEEGNKSMVMKAFQARLSRQAFPWLNQDGLVEHAIRVASGKAPHSFSGPDVEWILTAGEVKATTRMTTAATPLQLLSNGVSQSNAGVTSESTFRPFRSAKKRLPWEKDTAEGESTVATTAPLGPSGGTVANGQWNGLQATPTLPAHLTNPSPLSPVVSPTSTWLHPPPKRAGITGGTPFGTSLKKLAPSYTDLHLAKLQYSVNATTSSRPIPISRSNRRASLNVPLGPLGTASGAPRTRKTSIPDGLLTPLRDQEGIDADGPRGVALDGRYPPSSSVPTGVPPEPQGGGMGMSPGMSVSWPRSRGGPTTFTRASHQISADASKAAGVQGSVRTNVIRPLSKPRVRNPITLLTQKQQQQQQAGPQHSPTQLEQEFLLSSATAAGHTSWTGEGWDEEEYYTIPEDTAILDSSLSSSLCSLYGNSRDTDTAKTKDIDKLKHIRKQAASRKAQLLSTSNSPDLTGTPPRHSSGEGEKGWTQSSVSAPTKKSKKTLSQSQFQSQSQPHVIANLSAAGGIKNGNLPIQSLDLDLNSTYTVMEAESDSRHVRALECEPKKQKKSSGKSKSTSHGKRNSPTEEADAVAYEMSLQGHSFDQGGGAGEGTKEAQPKKKSRKIETVPRGNVPPKVRSNSLRSEVQRRPTIERGGTNTIEMEISGVGSLKEDGDSNGYPSQPSLSQATKESIMRKRQKQLAGQQQHSPPEGTSPKTLSATYPSSKPPLPPQATADVTTASAPLPHVRQRQRGRSYSNSSSHSNHQSQAESGYVTAGDETPKQQFTRTNSNGADSSSTANGSPNGGTLEELHPFSNPEQALREALKNLEDSDWNSKCDGMLAVRRVAMFHPEILGPQLHNTVLAVQQEVKNLRSTVARGAIACLGDLFALMGRAMEQDLDGLVSILLRKGADSSAFIRGDVEKALGEMVANVSPGKGLLALISGGLAHRSVQVRKTTSQFVCASVERYGPGRLLTHGNRDVLERTLTATVQLVGDANPDCRYYGRKCLNQLWPQPDFDRVAARVLSDQLMGRTREAIDNLKAKGVGDPPSESHSAKYHSSSRHSTGGTVRMSTNGSPSSGGHKNSVSEHGANGAVTTGVAVKEGSSKRSRKYHSSTQELPSLGASEVPLPDRLCERMKANDWNTRYEAVSELEQFVDAYPTALGPHLHKVFDAFAPRLTDRNSKVNLHALQAFSNIIPLLGNSLVPVLNNVITALVPNLASRNGTIHSIALTVLDLLSQCIDAFHLLQPVASNGQYSNARVQPIMIKKLAELTTMAFDQKPQLVKRQVLPVMWHLLTAKTSSSTEAKTAMLALCAALYDLMGQTFLDSASHLSPEHQKQLVELVQSLNR